MIGQLVIAELEAFQSVIGRAKPADGDVIRAWARSTITNAVHRSGPNSSGLKDAATRAMEDADRFAALLEKDGLAGATLAQSRESLIESLTALIAAVRGLKTVAPQEPY